MVADVHRTLKYGGIFMYPATGLFKCLLLFEHLRGSVYVHIWSSRTSPIYLVVPQHPTPTASCESCTSVCPWLTSSNRLEELQAPDCKFHYDNEYVIPAKGMTTLKVPTFNWTPHLSGSPFWTSHQRSFMSEARSSSAAATMWTTYSSWSRRTERPKKEMLWELKIKLRT